jgi:hypothetical protein
VRCSVSCARAAVEISGFGFRVSGLGEGVPRGDRSAAANHAEGVRASVRRLDGAAQALTPCRRAWADQRGTEPGAQPGVQESRGRQQAGQK